MNLDKIIRIEIHADYERAESSGVSGSYQVSSVYGYDENDNEFDLTSDIDQGKFFESGQEVAKKLGFDPTTINIDFV